MVRGQLRQEGLCRGTFAVRVIVGIGGIVARMPMSNRVRGAVVALAATGLAVSALVDPSTRQASVLFALIGWTMAWRLLKQDRADAAV